jgi:hypothetical protein
MIYPDPFLDLIPRLDGDSPRAPTQADLDDPATVLAIRNSDGHPVLTRVGLVDVDSLSAAAAVGVVDCILIDDDQLGCGAR